MMRRKYLWNLGLSLLVVFILCTGCSNSSDDPQPVIPDVIPEQTVEPVISAVGIGVPDLTDATDFFTAIGLVTSGTPDYLDVDGMDEQVMVANNAKGGTLVLMNDPSADPAIYMDNPDKVVFIVPDATTFYQAIMDNGGGIVGDQAETEPQVRPEYGDDPVVIVGLAYDPNGYLIEMIQIDAISITDPYIVGVGIGVSDLVASQDYYTRILGMVFSMDLDVPGFMDEKELASPSGQRPNMVLMHYDDPMDYTDNPVKLVLSVPDAQTFFSVIEEENADLIVTPPATLASGAISGYAKDLNGTTIQVVQPAP